ncbi:MAG: sorbosone dehydrogenase family protein [Thermoleophilia bacterium]
MVWDIAFLPDGRALITERPGRVRIAAPDSRLLPTPAAEIGGLDGCIECGVLGVAVDPAFAAGQPFVYVSLTADGEFRVQRFRLMGNTLLPESVVLRVASDGAVHNSGRVRFGPDGALYVGTGDADDDSRAQAAGSLNGRILRVAPDSYRGGEVTPEVVAMGLRHPQGLAWQPGSGRFFATDHGPDGDDELNLIVSGGNYGWPIERGPDQNPFVSPVVNWATTIAPASIAFITQPGSTWTGRAIVTALRGQQMRLITFAGGTATDDQSLYAGTFGRLRAIAEAPDGSIWVGTSNRDQNGSPREGDDRILRLVPPAGGASPAPPATNPVKGTGACSPAAQPGAPKVHPGPLARRLAKSQRVARLALRQLRRIEAHAEGRAAPRACGSRARAVRATYRQLRITVRISAAALRLHAELSSQLLGHRIGRPTPRLTLVGKGRTPVTNRQVQRAERIAQAALRRANALARAVRRSG